LPAEVVSCPLETIFSGQLIQTANQFTQPKNEAKENQIWPDAKKKIQINKLYIYRSIFLLISNVMTKVRSQNNIIGHSYWRFTDIGHFFSEKSKLAEISPNGEVNHKTLATIKKIMH
jgi:hypothetical protein